MMGITAEQKAYIGRFKLAIEYLAKTKGKDFATDEKIGKAVGAARPTVTNWGRNRPMPQEYITKFCEYTGVNERWLISGKGGMEANYVEKLEAIVKSHIESLQKAVGNE